MNKCSDTLNRKPHTVNRFYNRMNLLHNDLNIISDTLDDKTDHVPISHEERYFSCSGVSVSISIPMD
jgi:hypothetical protein